MKTINFSKKYDTNETPCNFGMCYNKTSHFKGEKQIDILDTSNNKFRFIVARCTPAAGKLVHNLIILKGLKNMKSQVARIYQSLC